MQSSYPFLSVDYFIEISDIALLEIGHTLPNMTKYNYPVIFVKTEILNNFIDSLLSIQKPYKLITGCNDDMAVPYIHYPTNDTYIIDRHNRLLDHSYLLKWYSKNICIHHPKLTAIPIGPKMQWHTSNFFGEDKTKLLERYNKYYLKPQELLLNSESKPNLLYMNMDASTTNDPFYKDHANIRKNTIDSLVSKGFTLSQGKANEEYILELQTYKFCISPPGRGIDAHRTWEALMLGTIPICISSSLDSIYEKLPVLILSDYSCITREYLNEQYTKMKDKEYDFSVLYCDYWKHTIEN